MLLRPLKLRSCPLPAIALAALLAVLPHEGRSDPGFSASIPPERCAGYGALQTISLSDWESGVLGSWSASTYGIVDPAAFATPDWDVVGDLPDARPGTAAFVADPMVGDCGTSDQTGGLRLTSPTIVIPGGAEVPRISINHWFELQDGWDGGILSVSVNGGPFEKVQPSAIELRPYNDVLEPAIVDLLEWNTNPLAGELAYTGTDEGYPTGRWGQTRINLLGIASGGDSIRLRFDFGQDCLAGAVGWYVDEVEFYFCEAELAPSNCGNGVLNGPEQCDDGNSYIGDGCSNTCEIEEGWTCQDPTPAGGVADPSFEDGRNNSFWDDVANNSFGSPICRVSDCGLGAGSGAAQGSWWAWFGGIKPYFQGYVSQSVTIPSTADELTFELEVPFCDSAQDYLQLLIDGNELWRIDGGDPACGQDGYVSQTIDIGAYADDGLHDLEFYSETVSSNGSVTNFFVDVVEIPGTPSICRRPGTNLTLVKGVINDSGGEATASQWTLSASGPTGFSGPGPRVSSGEGFAPGIYDLSESAGPSGYAPGDWICTGGTQVDGDTVNIGLDEAVTCTIRNDDIPPTLTVLKTILNDNGGPITDPDVFGLTIDGLPAQHGVANVVDVGDHTVAEVPQAGYQAGAWGGDCSPDGRVTLALGQNATCTITNDDIPATLTLVKQIVNDNGGTIVDPDAFGLTIDGEVVPAGVPLAVDAGSRMVSEVGLPGYLPGSWSGDCAPNGSISLAPGQLATCTLTNDDVEPALTLVKQVLNDHGGTASGAEWTLSATGPAGFSGSGPSVSNEPGFLAGTYDLAQSSGPPGYASGAWMCVGGDQLDSDTVRIEPGNVVTCTNLSDDIPATLTLLKSIQNNDGGTVTNPNSFGMRIDGAPAQNNIPYVLSAGNHLVTEDGLSGYAPGPWGGDCNPDGSISLALAQNATCSSTSDDVPPTIRLKKTIVNDDNGTVTDPDAFGLRLDGAPVLHDQEVVTTVGNHVASEDGLAGYVAGQWSGDCATDGSVYLSVGQNATCTVVNNDVESSSLFLSISVTNNNGGTAQASDWTLIATGPSGFSGPGPNVFSPAALVAGTYDLSVSGPTTYSLSGWFCEGANQLDGDTVEVQPGDTASCSAILNDIGPRLKIVNSIVNDSGGTVSDPNAFGLAINGAVVANDTYRTLNVGNHVVSQIGVPGYEASLWGGACSGDGSVSLGLGEEATCTIVNDDISPTLTLLKVIVNDGAGTVTDPDLFGLKIDGAAVLHGVANEVDAGLRTASEAGYEGYVPGVWTGDCNPDGTILLALDQDATCTIENDDVDATSLTLAKQVINDDGGGVLASAWTLTATGTTGFSGPGPSVSSGSGFEPGTYDLSESGPTGYAAGDWVCIGGTQDDADTVTLAPGESATCTVTNDDIAPTLRVVKTIVNDNGGTVVDPDAFDLRIDGDPVQHDAVNTLEAGPHVVSEIGLAGYAASDWGGDCNPDGSITLALDQHATCTLTNDDQAPNLTLVKQVVNNNGGSAAPSTWTLHADGPAVLSGSGPSVSSGASFKAGSYDLSESGGPAGYAASAWNCVGGLQTDADTLTLTLGESATCTIVNDDIAPTLKVVKTIVNDNGGSETNPNAFGLRIDGSIVQHNVATTLAAGAHVVSEDGRPGYTAGDWGGDCNPDGSITLVPGQNAVCTITNDDAAPGLTLVKQLVNDDGGTAPASAWTLTATGATGFSGPGPSVSSGANFETGTYDLSENGPAGYASSDWVCDGGTQNDGNTVTLELGESATCTITNNDIAPTLKVVKSIINNNGGTETDPNAFGLRIDGNPVQHDVVNSLDAGPHVVSEDGLDGYAPGSWGGDCNPDGSITLALAESATCTITNNDIGPTLKIVKTIVNDDGGTENNPNAFGLRIDGVPVQHNIAKLLSPGVHTASEIGLAGYAAGPWGGDCDANGVIILELGQQAVCTITNDDIAPTLTVFKTIVNDNGGTQTDPNAFGLRVDGALVQHNVATELEAGSHQVSEDGLAGYVSGPWGGACASDGSVTLALAQNAICTITNNDVQTGLTLSKQVINDDGGTADGASWMLTAAGPTGFSGPGPTVFSGSAFQAGTYDLSESGGPDGYAASAWVCVGGTQNDADTITLSQGQKASCTITNNDIAPTLTVVKTIVNDNGGTETDPNAFGLRIDGNVVQHEVATEVTAGSHIVSEDGLPGYVPGTWGGDCAPDGSITLGLGDAATCTISNDDAPPGLTLVKQVINDNGGIALPSAWTLAATGPTGFSGAGPTVSSGADFEPGTYDLSESGPAGYSAGGWVCEGGTQDDADTVTLAFGENAICTLINNDLAPSLTLVKEVVNDNGGAAAPSAWTLHASGATPLSGKGPSVSSGATFQVGSYDLSESGGPAGYTAGGWSCVGGTQNDSDTVTLALGDNAVCTIVNDDISPTLKVVKTVVNDNGGTQTDPDAFGLRVDGAPVQHDAVNPFDAGLHTVSEVGLAGYGAGDWGGDCNPDGSITLSLDQDAVCTLTNDDLAPSLTLVKVVVNDNGGSTGPSAWTLIASGPTPLSGSGPSVSSNAGFNAGTYDLSEAGPGGYTASDWVCIGGVQDDADTVTLALGQTATCTITNDDRNLEAAIFKDGFESN